MRCLMLFSALGAAAAFRTTSNTKLSEGGHCFEHGVHDLDGLELADWCRVWSGLPPEGVEAPSAIRFIFFNSLSMRKCKDVQAMAISIGKQIGTSKNLFGAYVQTHEKWEDEEKRYGSLGFTEMAVDPDNRAWNNGRYFAAVVGGNSQAVTMFEGSNYRRADISGIGANTKASMQGATAWGFSMLLHRLKLLGAEKVKLTDMSRQKQQILGGRLYPSQGATVYERTEEEKRPYKFPWTSTRKPNSFEYADYTYYVTRESFGRDYSADLPC